MRSNMWNEATGPETRRFAAAMWMAAALVAQGCGDDGGGSSTSTSTSTSGTGPGGSGGASGSGGAGVGGDESGGGGAGGSGGGGCLDASLFDDLFSIDDAAFCAVALYTAPAGAADGGSPTWGRHGGPLLVSALPGGAVEITRLSPPAGATGELAKTAVTVELGLAAGTFLGSQALDLPFFGWTAISWTNAFPNTQGEVVLLDGGDVAKRYDVNGYFSAAAVSGRLLYTGLSQVGEGAAGTNALYAADSCGAPDQDPRLLPEGDATCAAPVMVASWGDYSDAVAADRSGNVFAVLYDAGTSERQARGFAAEKIARGAAPTDGDDVFTVVGGGSSLAALAPEGGAPGVLAFQSTDPDTYAALDPVALEYVVSSGAVQVRREIGRLLTLATPATSLALIADPENRLWVGAPSAGTGTTYVVLARR